ncbi:Holliday junction resolvase RuvX [Aliidiomarina iranensis]|uniref:Putative pre-16S rRNA nuclease n=1 Tax=Aliidiomarina iranensis TaxID=1434071 RepID=A0A432VV36_9GAMM|nr:Holliday junction resolvase RuvX [Aliidiomarina iranensis]RUO20397.1 Holliday junction resolvase RuvX [Aliidiomarina iranensis]
MSILAFDFGTKSIGVAVGSRITNTASPLAALSAKEGIPNWQLLEKLIKEWQPDFCVVGLPLNMDGTEQPLTDLARKFGNRLHGRFGVQVKYQDERLTTASVREELFARGGFRELSKGRVDSAAACTILEDFLQVHAE